MHPLEKHFVAKLAFNPPPGSIIFDMVLFMVDICFEHSTDWCLNVNNLLCQVSGDVSFVSSIDDEDDKEPTPYNEISENIYLIDK